MPPNEYRLEIRADQEFLEALERLSQSSGLTRAEVIRNSVGLFSEAIEQAAKGRQIRYLDEDTRSSLVAEGAEVWADGQVFAETERNLSVFNHTTTGGYADRSSDRDQAEVPTIKSRFPRQQRKRISRRRLAGQRVLAHVPTFNLEAGSLKPSQAARRYIAEAELTAPAILNVRRNEHTTDRFFWGEKGLFSAKYAEENHFLFPSLREIVDRIGEEVLFEGLEALASEDLELIEAQ